MAPQNKAPYQPPKQLKQWRNDIPNGELYSVYITDDNKLWFTSGRFAHASGACSVDIADFLAGQLNKQVRQGVFAEIITYLQQHTTTTNQH
ncbi:hypothetical protein [Shewanella sp.]|uniref:hypothetical protein n=1 Tax=Shewanella sp. TaxID=50422 RepID=UPI003A982966